MKMLWMTKELNGASTITTGKMKWPLKRKDRKAAHTNFWFEPIMVNDPEVFFRLACKKDESAGFLALNWIIEWFFDANNNTPMAPRKVTKWARDIVRWWCLNKMTSSFSSSETLGRFGSDDMQKHWSKFFVSVVHHRLRFGMCLSGLMNVVIRDEDVIKSTAAAVEWPIGTLGACLDGKNGRVWRRARAV